MSDEYQLRKDIYRLSNDLRIEIFDTIYPIGSLFFGDNGKPNIGEWSLVTESFKITDNDYTKVWRRIK